MFGGLTKMKYLCTRLQEQGFVAQLNRASDYGSEGSGFESQRSHFRRIARDWLRSSTE